MPISGGVTMSERVQEIVSCSISRAVNVTGDRYCLLDRIQTQVSNCVPVLWLYWLN